MATKAQKRAAGIAKHEAFLEEIRQSGLKALEADRQKRASEERQKWQEQHDKKHFKFVNECPLCADVKKAQRSNNTKEAVAKMSKSKITGDARNPFIVLQDA